MKLPYQEAPRRLMSFLLVFLLHAAALTFLLWREPRAIAVTRDLEIMVLPPPSLTVRTDTARWVKIADVPVSAPTPIFDVPNEASASAARGAYGAEVDWTAEAHRAVQAYEIRANQPQMSAVASPLLRETWLAEGEHQAGDEMKTPSGDWIVWIDANCYKLASWRSGWTGPSAGEGTTLCPVRGRD